MLHRRPRGGGDEVGARSTEAFVASPVSPPPVPSAAKPRVVVPLRNTLRPCLGAIALVGVILTVGTLLDPRSPPVEDAKADASHRYRESATFSPDAAFQPKPVSAQYRRMVFATMPPDPQCIAASKAAVAAVEEFDDVDSFLLPRANVTRSIRVRCFVSAPGTVPSAGDTACERDLLGLPWPIASVTSIALARGGEPVSTARTARESREREAEAMQASRLHDTSPSPALPYAPSMLPDYLGSREYVERHRFWRHAGRAGVVENERPKLFIDVGPNGGFHSLVASLYGFDVLALEPIPAAAEALREAICLNSYITSRITIANFTLGIKDATCELPFSSSAIDHSCYSTLSLPYRVLHTPGSSMEPLRIRHRPLDSLHLPYITVIKVDTGYRTLAVLMGMESTLRYGGIEDQSAIVEDEDANGMPHGRNANGPRAHYPVTLILIRVPLSEVRLVVEFLWDVGMAVFWRDLDYGALDTVAAVKDAVARASGAGGETTGMHLYARPKERVDVPDHVAALRATAMATAGR
jgi:FkbM family methyltransferase